MASNEPRDPTPTLPEWGRDTSPEFRRWARQSGAVVVQPVAAIEQHGPHLPLDTDLRLNLALLNEAWQVLERPDWIRVLPALAPGASGEHMSYAGTLSLAAEHHIERINALIPSLHHAGISRLLLWNTHGGNIGWIETAALNLRRANILTVKAHIFRLDVPALAELPESERRNGLHGGAIETALMRHLAPESVREDAIENFVSRSQGLTYAAPKTPARASLEPDRKRHGINEHLDDELDFEGQAAIAWLAEDLNPSGAVGDATAGTAALGARLSQQYATRLADLLKRLHQLDPDRVLAQRPIPSVDPDDSRPSKGSPQ
ncbi:MAG: creatininase family protein [Thioalkalivibrionaceae bacterium]